MRRRRRGSSWLLSRPEGPLLYLYNHSRNLDFIEHSFPALRRSQVVPANAR